jgi:hypothetical protein
MVVTWDAVYKIATFLVDTGMFICSAITVYVLTHKNDDNDKKKK